MSRRFHGPVSMSIFRYILEHFAPRKWKLPPRLPGVLWDAVDEKLKINFVLSLYFSDVYRDYKPFWNTPCPPLEQSKVSVYIWSKPPC